MNNSYSLIFILLMNKITICVVESWKSKPHKFAKSEIANKESIRSEVTFFFENCCWVKEELCSVLFYLEKPGFRFTSHRRAISPVIDYLFTIKYATWSVANGYEAMRLWKFPAWLRFIYILIILSAQVLMLLDHKMLSPLFQQFTLNQRTPHHLIKLLFPPKTNFFKLLGDFSNFET